MTYEAEHETEHETGRDAVIAPETVTGPKTGAEPAPNRLLAQGERDKLTLRLQQAVNTFVDGPRRAVEEADSILEETTRRLTESVAERRRSLRTTWAGDDRQADTEVLRIALRTYREVTERLLRI